MSYFDRHNEPGYWGDITKHFFDDDVVLDYGCGTGWLADHFKNYTGAETSAEAVARAQEADRNVVAVSATNALPFPDDEFTAVIAKDVLEHVDDPMGLVVEFRRVMAPGGRIYASSPDAQRWVWEDYSHRRPFPLTALRQLFIDHGFEIVGSGHETVIPGSSIVANLSRRHRRQAPLRVLGLVRFLRRNSWVVAEVSDTDRSGASADL